MSLPKEKLCGTQIGPEYSYSGFSHRLQAKRHREIYCDKVQENSNNVFVLLPEHLGTEEALRKLRKYITIGFSGTAHTPGKGISGGKRVHCSSGAPETEQN